MRALAAETGQTLGMTDSTTRTTAAGAAGTWQLGDRQVNRMGLGAMRLMGHGEQRPWERERALTVLRDAVDLGINHIDTAAFYFHKGRHANELIKAALHPYSEDLVIATKVGPNRDANGEFRALERPEQLREQVERNLRELGVEVLDVVNLRAGTGLERAAGPIGEYFAFLAGLREEGLIRHLGISNVGAEQLAEAESIAPVVCVQNQYSLVNRREDDALVRRCEEQDVAFVPFFAAGGGVAVDHPGLADVAARHGATATQVLLAWTLHKGTNVLAIPGTGDPAHLAENVAAAELHLTPDDVARLDPGT